MALRRSQKTPLDLILPLAGLLWMVWFFVPGGAQLLGSPRNRVGVHGYQTPEAFE